MTPACKKFFNGGRQGGQIGKHEEGSCEASQGAGAFQEAPALPPFEGEVEVRRLS